MSNYESVVASEGLRVMRAPCERRPWGTRDVGEVGHAACTEGLVARHALRPWDRGCYDAAGVRNDGERAEHEHQRLRLRCRRPDERRRRHHRGRRSVRHEPGERAAQEQGRLQRAVVGCRRPASEHLRAGRLLPTLREHRPGRWAELHRRVAVHEPDREHRDGLRLPGPISCVRSWQRRHRRLGAESVDRRRRLRHDYAR